MAGGTRLDDDEIISEINVTPLVDVMLVLLVIFMVTATYIVAQSIPVDLPEAGTGEEVVTTLAIAITADGEMYLDGKRVDDAAVRATVSKARKSNPDLRVIIAADKRIRHGKVVHVIDLIRKLGVARFAINIDAESGG